MEGNACSVLENALNRIAMSSGMNTDLRFSNLILTAHVDVLDSDILPGPPMQVSRNLGVTLYLADIPTRTKFSSAYVELKGVGTNETKCMIDAFKRLNASNKEIARMMADGQKKMVAYFDGNYQRILEEAKRKASQQQYEEAIALAISVPVCTKGGSEATRVGLEFYESYRDKENLLLLNKARAIWNSGQDREAARGVGYLLSQIDPDAACYTEADALACEIKDQLRSDIDFEMREKYTDQIEIEKAKIEAMRAVGVAYGKGQQPQTTNLTWLK